MLVRSVIAFFFLSIFFQQIARGQCSLITDNYSGQSPNSLCAPVDLTMEVRYKFITNVDPDKVEILYVWNDGTGATTTVPGISQGDTVFTASQTHTYPPADNCSYTAEAYVIYDGVQCVSSSRQEQTFSAWARDNENGAVITTEPVVAQFCEGDDIVDVTFDDNSTFNCNIAVEPDKPNRLTRWVQFIYGTQTIGGDRIPLITVTDPLGNTYPMTDASGSSSPQVAGPVIEIPIPADGPNQTSWSISAPAGGIAGDIFEITMRNWNICNPYDATPFDSLPAGDTVDGDYAPITTTALIEIITTPPRITNPSLEFCVDNPVNLTLSTSGGDIQWYADSGLTMPVHTGNSFDPTGPPTYLDNSIAGEHSFWVTETIGECTSAPSRISFEIFDNPTPPSDAGADRAICNDTTSLSGSIPVIGEGIWTTTGGAVISDPLDPATRVSDLDPGPNLFRWSIHNGPCVSVDEVIITRDLQPGPASAGTDQSFCDNTSAVLNANTPDNDGEGTWTIISGGGTINNPASPSANINDLPGGFTGLVWTIESRYSACETTTDTLEILRDVTPDPANAGADRGVCDSSRIMLNGNTVTGGGSGMWTVLSGNGTLADPDQPNAIVSNLSFGDNTLQWEISSHFGICPGSSDEVTVTRDEAPDPAFAGFDQSLCNVITTPLGANPASAGTGTWTVVTNPSGTTPDIAPSIHNENATIEIQPGNEGVYELAWTIVNYSCVTSDTITIDFGVPTIPADAGNDDSICGYTVPMNANDPGIGTGTWSTVSGPGTVTFLPNLHTPNAIARINPGDEGLYLFEWKISSGSCPPTFDTVAIYFKPLPGIPSAGDESLCGPGRVTLNATIGINGNTNHWYDAATGGNLLGTNQNYTTDVLTSSQTFWVASYNDTTGCESIRRRVNVNIHRVPDAPVTLPVENCGPDNFTVQATIGSGGTNNHWFDAPSGGTLLSASKNYNTPLITDSANYWVSTFNDTTACESDRTKTSIIIHPVPDMPVANSQSICGPGTLTLNSSIGMNGNRNNWYNSSTGGMLVSNSPAFTTPHTDSTLTYWVSSSDTVTGCESSRREVRAIIHPVPMPPVTSDIDHCGPDSLELMASPGTNGTTVRWYDNLLNGNLLGEDTRFLTPYLSSDAEYWLTSYNDSTQCEGSFTPLHISILPVPGVNPILGAGQAGIGQTNVIYSVAYHEGSTYNWDIPPGINLLLENQNFVILEFPNLGTYNISMQETNSFGCPGPVETRTIQVLEDILFINLNILSGEICAGQPLQINAEASGGTPSYTFEWTGDTAFLNTKGSSDPLFSADAPGNYNLFLRVYDVNGNDATESLAITVHPNPNTSIIYNDTIVCAGDELPLNATVSGGSGNYEQYNWEGDITPLSSTDTRHTVFNSLVNGRYDLLFTVQDDKGCTARDSVSIYNNLPRSMFATDAYPACSPATFSFFNQSEDAVEYHWDFGDGNTTGEPDPTHEFRNTTTSVEYYNVTLTAVSEYGCSHTANKYITIYPNPVTGITTDPLHACNPADVLLSATPGGYTYNWDFGDGNTEEGGYNILHRYTNESGKDTSYFITLITTSFFNCFDTSFAEITVYPSPEAVFEASPEWQMYPDRTVYLDNMTEDANWDYKWYFGDKTISYEKDPGEHFYGEADEYTISLVVKSEHCYDSVSKNIEIVPHPPVARFNPVQPGCMPLTIRFENTSSYSTTFLWEFGDGAVSNKPNPEYTYYEAGKYNIRLKATGPGGTDTYSTINSVYILPNAFFDLAPRHVYVNDEEVHFFNLSDNGDIYEWDFGDGTTSNEFNPTHMYTEEGVYDITLRVWTDKDCFDLYVKQNAVFVEPSGKLIFPNVFRPDSPLKENRVFKPGVMDQVKEYHLMIFNRWGELIFESHDRDIGWDGYVDGKMAKQDVYVWKVEGSYTNGQAFVDSGDVTLLH